MHKNTFMYLCNQLKLALRRDFNIFFFSRAFKLFMNLLVAPDLQGTHNLAVFPQISCAVITGSNLFSGMYACKH